MLYTEELEAEENVTDETRTHGCKWSDGMTEFHPISDPMYSSPMHLDTLYYGQADGDEFVFRPWKNPFELDFTVLEWMAEHCNPDDFSAYDLDYIKEHGAFNEELGYEAVTLGNGIKCKQCSSPEARMVNVSRSDGGQQLESLCNECLVAKMGRSRRRNPRGKKTQDVWGYHGYTQWVNEERKEKGAELLCWNQSSYFYGTDDLCDKPYMQMAPKVNLPLTEEELETLG